MRSGVPQGSAIGSLLLLLFMKDLRDALEALTLLFINDVKMVTSQAQKISSQGSLNTGQRIGTCRSTVLSAITLQLDELFTVRFSFLPDGLGTHTPLSRLAKNLWFQTENAFSPSAKCTNKVSGLIFMIRRSVKIGLNFILWGTGASKPRRWYACLFAKPRERCQPPGLNSNISYTAVNLSSLFMLRRETAVSGLSFPAGATSSG